MRFRVAHPKVFLPLIMFLSVLLVGVRVNELWTVMADGKVFPVVATASAAAEAAPAPAAAPSPPPVTTEGKDAQGAGAAVPAAASAPEAALDDASSAEAELIKQLTDRRDQLEKRNHALDAREALIRVAEQRVDQKIKEMETLRTQLQSMVNQAGAAQQQQLDNLVKIYETMKPKEAAKIFMTMELPVLLGVVQRMKPQRTAPIMAEMDPEKAKEITVALTKQDQLPPVK